MFNKKTNINKYGKIPDVDLLKLQMTSTQLVPVTYEQYL